MHMGVRLAALNISIVKFYSFIIFSLQLIPYFCIYVIFTMYGFEMRCLTPSFACFFLRWWLPILWGGERGVSSFSIQIPLTYCWYIYILCHIILYLPSWFSSKSVRYSYPPPPTPPRDIWDLFTGTIIDYLVSSYLPIIIEGASPDTPNDYTDSDMILSILISYHLLAIMVVSPLDIPYDYTYVTP